MTGLRCFLWLESRRDLRIPARLAAEPAKDEPLHDSSSVVVYHFHRDSRCLRLFVRVLGGEVERVAGAADAVYLVGAPALLGAQLESSTGSLIHNCQHGSLSLDEALCLVQLGALPKLYHCAC